MKKKCLNRTFFIAYMYKNFNPKPPTSQSLSLKLQTNEKMLYSENSTRKRFREMVGTEMFKIKLTGE